MAKLTLNREQRKELITALVTNCSGWDEEDIDLLVNMAPEKLVSHVENCAQLVANADPEDDSGLPDSLEPSSASEEENEVEDGWEEEEDPTGDQGDNVASTKQDQEKDQPTMDKKKKVAVEVTENEYLDHLPPRIRSVVLNALKFENEQKKQLVGQITANSRNRFSERYLMNLGLQELQALSELATPPKRQSIPMFIGGSGGPTFNEDPVDREDILTIPTLEFSRKN